MINASKEFNQVVYGQENKIYVGKATIKLYDNTVLEVDSSEIWQGGIEITEQTSNSGNFDIGFCSSKQLVLRLKNINNEFSSYDFYDAEIVPFVGLELSETTEYIKKGVFTVDDPASQGPYISLTCLDNMHKLDKKVANLSGNTTGQIVLNIANACGVTISNVNFDGYNKELDIPEDVTQYTYRQVLSYICQVIGAFAFFNVDGNLEIKWYDTGAFEQADNLDGGTFDSGTPYSTGDNADGGDFTFTEIEDYDGGTFTQTDRYHHIYSLKSAGIGTDDVVITGIRVTNDEETYLYGEDGYVLEIENNPFTLGKENLIATHLGQKIIGMQFRPLSVAAQSNPLIEAGDPAYVSHKGNSYKCFITNSTFTIGQSSQLSCDAQSPQSSRTQGLSGNTKAIIQARRVAKKEISSYDLAMQQLTNLMTNSFGVFKSEEILEDGSVIYYMHDKPTLAESQTIWKMTTNTFTVSTNGGQTWNAGIDSSGNAVVNVLNAIGINAEWVRAGKLMSASGESYFDLNNNKIKTNNAEITGGTINIETSGEEVSRIKTKYKKFSNEMRPLGMYAENSEINMSSILQAAGLWLYEGDKNTLVISGSDGIFTDHEIRAEGNISAHNQIYAKGSIFTDRQIQAKDTIFSDNNIRAKGFVRATTRLAVGESVYTDYMLSIYGGNAYISGSLSAETIIDRTPYYDGNALEELSRVKDDGNGGIDHSTLPKFAQVRINQEVNKPKSGTSEGMGIVANETLGEKRVVNTQDVLDNSNATSMELQREEKTKEVQQGVNFQKSIDGIDDIQNSQDLQETIVKEVEGRDIGAMVSVLTKAIQQLISKNEEQDALIEDQSSQIKQLQEKLGE